MNETLQVPKFPITEILQVPRLSIIEDMFANERNAEIKLAIDNLKPVDLDTSEKYAEVLENLKAMYTFTPVVYDEPKIVDHIPLPEGIFATYVKIDFTGSNILFHYRPGNLRNNANEPNIIFQPQEKNIVVQVNSGNLEDKHTVITKAKLYLVMTQRITMGNNNFINNWNLSVGNEIESKLKLHKNKLDEFYN